MTSFGRRIAKLGAAVFVVILSYLYFDTFAVEDAEFPPLVPFYDHQTAFANIDWTYFEAAAVIVAGIVTMALA